MAKEQTYTDDELKEKMSVGITKMMGVLEDDGSDAHQKVQAANALSGLVKRYKELFDTEHDEGKSTLRSVKNF